MITGYPSGFFPKNVDGRIDDPNAGWKGKALWSTSGIRTMFHRAAEAIGGGPISASCGAAEMRRSCAAASGVRLSVGV